ncbi:hypothetical protein ACF3DV_09820 [Chlorogloeopsis fritschii PCC 9212]|nr:hypothetical protein [Chlorogloeopsis fritschii]
MSFIASLHTIALLRKNQLRTMIELPENIRIDESLAREAAPQLKLSLAV